MSEHYIIEGHYLMPKKGGGTERVWLGWLKIDDLETTRKVIKNNQDLKSNELNQFNKLRIVKVVETREIIE